MSTIYIPYGSFAEGDSHDQDYLAIEADEAMLSRIRRSVLREVYRADIVRINDWPFGPIAAECVAQTMPELAEILPSLRVPRNTLLKAVRENTIERCGQCFFEAFHIRKAYFAALQLLALERDGVFCWSKYSLERYFKDRPMWPLRRVDYSQPQDIREAMRLVAAAFRETSACQPGMMGQEFLDGTFVVQKYWRGQDLRGLDVDGLEFRFCDGGSWTTVSVGHGVLIRESGEIMLVAEQSGCSVSYTVGAADDELAERIVTALRDVPPRYLAAQDDELEAEDLWGWGSGL